MIVRVLGMLTLVSALCAQPKLVSRVQAEQAESEGFVPARDIDAVAQPGSSHVSAHLQAGQSYPLIRRGGPGHNWCKLQVTEAGAWVPCSAANTRAVAPSNTPAAEPPSPATAAKHREERTSSVARSDEQDPRFSYYVLTLSWSPAFCRTQAAGRNPEQCGAGRHYAFVVHGLWPQRERGWPQACGVNDQPSAALIDHMLDLMPSQQLIRHEWQKHGTCSGLSAQAYFDKLRQAYESIHMPKAYISPTERFTTTLQDIERAFTEANPDLTRDGIAVQCRRELQEVRICLDKQLNPRSCGKDVRDACKGQVTVLPTR